MSWRDRLIPASFRGAKFFVESSERSGGRRTVKHEFFGRDDQYVEDTGRKGRGFNVEAYVLGDNYNDLRDSLIAALEDTEGPGELLHPYHGTRQVICEDFRQRENVKEGGIAFFSITFAATPAAPAFPTAALDAAAALKGSAVGALAAAKSEFLTLSQVGALAATGLAKLTTMVGSASSTMGRLLGPLTATTQALAQLKASLVELTDNAGSLVRAPATLFDNIAGMVGALEAAGDPVRGVRALLSAYGFDPGTPRPLATTPRRLIEQITHDANQRMIQRINLVQATLVALEGVAARGTTGAFPSYEDAIAVRSLLTDKLDEQLEIAGDTVFSAFMQLRADLASAIPGNVTDLAHLVSFTPVVTLPALLLSHRLYGNLDGEADLIARNLVRHPGFIAGGVDLQVLSEL